MYIDQLEISGFGIYADLLLNPINGLNIILGPNEAGKSTCHEFVRFVLYGPPTGSGSRTHPRYEPLRGGEHGGSLELVTLAGQSFRLSRKGKTPTKFQLIDERGEELGAEMLAHILGQAGSELYNTVFAFSINELYDLNALDPRQVPDVLCGINFGLGNISVSTVLKDLDQQRGKLYKPGGSNPALNELFKELRQVEDRLAPMHGNLEQYMTLERDLGQLAEKDRDLQAELDKLLAEQVKFKTAQRLFPLWQERNELEEALKVEAAAGAENFQADDPVRFEHLQEQAGACLAATKQVQSRLGEVQARLAQPEPFPALLEVDELLADLMGRRGQFVESSRLIPERQVELEAVQEQTRRIQEELDQYWTYAKAKEFNFSKDVKEQLEQLLADIKQSERDAAVARDEYDRLGQELKALVAPQNLSELQSAHSLGENLSLARELKSGRDRLLLELQKAEFQQGEIRRTKQIGWLLLGVYFGAWGGVLTGVSQGTTWGLLAALVLLAVFAVPALFVSGQKNQRLTSIQKELQDNQEQISAVQATLGLSGLEDSDLRSVERRKDLAVQAEQIKARQDTEAAKAEVAGNSFNGLSLKLREFLILLGISPDCSPGQVRAIMDQVRELQPLVDRENALKSEIARLDKHLEGFSNGLFLLLARTVSQWKLDPQGAPDPLATLDHVAQRTQAAKSDAAERGRFEQQLTALVAESGKLEAKRQQAEEAVQEFIRIRGLSAPQEFAPAHAQWLKRCAAAARLAQVRNEITTGAGENAEAISHLLSYISEQKLERQLFNIAGHCREQERLLKDCREERGRLRQQRDALLDERQFEDLQFKQAALQEEIAERAAEWAVLSLARHAIAGAKSFFEQERQPEVMRLASGLFREITSGEYAGISPSSEPGALIVLTDKNEPRAASQLSRGTREQLFLAMRLALIHERSRDAEPLPILMDDILVNFDPERAKSAARSVLALADTHQIFFFTCHPHTARQLEALGLETGCPVNSVRLGDGRVQMLEKLPEQI